MNKRQLTIGSLVGLTNIDMNDGVLICEVITLLPDEAQLKVLLVLAKDYDKIREGQIVRVPYTEIAALPLNEILCPVIGFVESDQRGWQFKYYFGDMDLLARCDSNKRLTYLRYKSRYSKTYLRISCMFVHELQNIMRFLTGGELEFTISHAKEGDEV